MIFSIGYNIAYGLDGDTSYDGWSDWESKGIAGVLERNQDGRLERYYSIGGDIIIHYQLRPHYVWDNQLDDFINIGKIEGRDSKVVTSELNQDGRIEIFAIFKKSFRIRFSI